MRHLTVSRGTVISSILPGRARQSNRPGKTYGEGRAPGPRGAALLLKLLNFSCSRCSFPSDHSDHFLVNINNGELHRVLHVDGIWVARDLVVLICCSGERVVSWYMARSENSRAWSALMAPIPAPEVVVTDGGSGFAKAVRETWARTRVQRCTFHAFSQVKRYTTTRPKLQAGREPYLIARDLMGIETPRQAELWVERYLDWCGFWADFLEDRIVK